MMMYVSLYLPTQTWIHRLDGRTKILTTCGIFIIALCFSRPLYLLAVFAVVLLGMHSARAGPNIKKMSVLTILLFVYSVALWPFFVEGMSPVPILYSLGLTWEGLMVGMGMGLRLLILLWGGIWLLSTTTIEELAQASHQLGLPSRVGFAFSLAFRWVGMLLGAGMGVVQAQRSRGLDVTTGGIFQRIKKYVPLVVPVIGHALRQTNLLAMALESKGFHPSAIRQSQNIRNLELPDYLMVCAMGMAVGISVWMRWEGTGVLAIQF